MGEYEQLIQEVRIAEDNFNNATGEFVSIATYELLAAEKKLNQYLKERRSNVERSF